MDNYEPWTVRIHDNETGETVVYVDEYGSPDGETFIWEEGNYACDCNRGQFFYGVKDVWDVDFPCGDERFAVLDITRPAGEVIYAERMARKRGGDG